MKTSTKAVILLLAVVALLTACGGDDDPDASPTSRASSETVAATAPAQTPQANADPATAALYATWRTIMPEGDRVTLILRPGRYSISRGGPAGAGEITATAGEVEFFGSNLCDGTGRYAWSITDGELTLTSIGADACTNRSLVLDGRAYTK